MSDQGGEEEIRGGEEKYLTRRACRDGLSKCVYCVSNQGGEENKAQGGEDDRVDESEREKGCSGRMSG